MMAEYTCSNLPSFPVPPAATRYEPTVFRTSLPGFKHVSFGTRPHILPNQAYATPHLRPLIVV